MSLLRKEEKIQDSFLNKSLYYYLKNLESKYIDENPAYYIFLEQDPEMLGQEGRIKIRVVVTTTEVGVGTSIGEERDFYYDTKEDAAGDKKLAQHYYTFR
jgi:hypothetical protein